MSRRHSRSRVSQALVAILVGVVALALIGYFTRSTPKSADIARGPTTAPANPASAAAPTTNPAAPDGAVASSDRSPALPPLLLTSTPTDSTPRPAPAAGVAPARPLAEPATRPAARWEQLVPRDADARAVAATPADPADAQRQLEAGNLLAARAGLNAALLSGKLGPAEIVQTRRKLAELNDTLVFSTRRFPDDPFGGTYTVQNGDSLQKIARAHNVTWELLGRLNDISDPRKLRAGRSIKVINGPFHAVVSKTTYEMDLWLGEPYSAGAMFVTTFRVGLGKSDSTPTGTWLVTQGGKQKNPKFWGAGDLPPMEADDPKNPLGEFWLGLTGLDGNAEGRESYGIHGTIEPDSIGRQASLGCIRLGESDIALVYELLADGKSKVYIRD